MNAFVKDKVRVTLEKLLEFSEKQVGTISELQYIPCEYKTTY